MPSLSDKLKSLGVQIGTKDIQPRKKQHKYPIEKVIDGRFVETPYGQSFVVENLYPQDYHQGQTPLNLSAPLNTIAAWIADPRLLDMRPQSFVFLDTETSGLAGGSGTYTFLIGVGRFVSDGFNLAQYFMRDPIEELSHLTALLGFLGDFEGLVTFNGKAFDIPLLNARFITNGEIPPFNSAIHIDLLPLARRLWRDRLPSRTLGSLEENILGVKRTLEDIPGWLIPSLYFDYLRSGDARPLKNVFYHNAMDVLSMAALLNFITNALTHPNPDYVSYGVDLIAIGKLFEDLGDLDSAVQCYERGLSCQISEQARAEAVMRWSYLEKRRQNFEIAIQMWLEATTRQEIYAHIELAKVYEHRMRDYQEALRWTQAALELLNSPGIFQIDFQTIQPELEHRLQRLLRKMNL